MVAQLFSTRDAAAQLGLAASTVRKICQRSGIGKLVARTRLLTTADIAKVKADIRQCKGGGPKNGQQHPWRGKPKT